MICTKQIKLIWAHTCLKAWQLAFAMMHMAEHKMGLHQRRSAENCLLMKWTLQQGQQGQH